MPPDHLEPLEPLPHPSSTLTTFGSAVAFFSLGMTMGQVFGAYRDYAVYACWAIMVPVFVTVHVQIIRNGRALKRNDKRLQRMRDQLNEDFAKLAQQLPPSVM